MKIFIDSSTWTEWSRLLTFVVGLKKITFDSVFFLGKSCVLLDNDVLLWVLLEEQQLAIEIPGVSLPEENPLMGYHYLSTSLRQYTIVKVCGCVVLYVSPLRVCRVCSCSKDAVT